MAGPAGLLDRLRHSTSTGMQLGEFDALRGYAIAGVMLSHAYGMAGLPRWDVNILGVAVNLPEILLYQGGAAGVDLFFFISGFLLFLSWGKAAARGGGRPDPREFFRRRAYRIIPAYYAAIFFIQLLSSRLFFRVKHGNLLNVVTHVLFVHNFSRSTMDGISPVFWSMAVEAQFYVVLPLLAVLFTGRKWLLAFPAVAAVSLVSRFSGVIFSAVTPEDCWFMVRSLPSVLAEFAVGMVAANLWLRAGERHRPRGMPGWPVFAAGVIVCALSLGLLAVPGFSGWELPPYYRIYWTLPFAAGIGIAVYGLLHSGRVLKAVVCNPAAEFLGIISYSLYLYHVYIFERVLDLTPVVKSATGFGKAFYLGVFGGIISVLAATASYWYIERPFLSARGKNSGAREVIK